MTPVEEYAAGRLLADRHKVDCADTQQRLEQVRNGPRTSWGDPPALVIRCLSCGASMALLKRPDPLTPGSPEWEAAWRLQPSRITDALTAAELDDPKLNPRHVAATSWPPGREPEIPTTYGGYFL